MQYIVLYIFSILLIYILLFRDFFSRIFTRVGIVYLNDAELRWWWGMITMMSEIYLFLWIPYRFQKYSHEELNQYSEPSIYPFKDYLTPDLFFRDTNFGFFHRENFERMSYFYERNFSRNAPDIWLSIPYSFLEKVFIFPWKISFHWFKLQRSNLFRSLSHISGDNSLPSWKRKYILFGILLHWFYLCLIPWVPHFLLMTFYRYRKNHDIWQSWYDNASLQYPYIWICENNIKWRKWNRYMYSSHEYLFHVHSFDEKYIYWSWKIIIQKRLSSEEHFPYVWEYKFSLHQYTSEDFLILWWTNVYLSVKPGSNLYHEIPFEFKLPKFWRICIPRQSCLQNTEILVTFETAPFIVIPSTNLMTQNDHWHFSRVEFNNEFIFNYSISPDLSPLRMIYRAILRENIVQITFQKPLRKNGKFEFTYNNKTIPLENIEYLENNTILVFHLWENIPYYSQSERKNTLKVTITSLEDESWCVHYSEEPRIIWFPWINTWEK